MGAIKVKDLIEILNSFDSELKVNICFETKKDIENLTYSFKDEYKTSIIHDGLLEIWFE